MGAHRWKQDMAKIGDNKPKRGRPIGSRNKPTLALVAECGATLAEPINVFEVKQRGKGKNEYGLTNKQEKYARLVANGETLAAAYRASYDVSNMQNASIWTESCKLMNNPVIVARVDMLSKAKARDALHDATRIRLHVIERLQAEANDATSPPAARIRALELLGKLTDVGAFRERVVTEDTSNNDAEDIAATLEAKLEALLKSA